jgi:hypothetical protein
MFMFPFLLSVNCTLYFDSFYRSLLNAICLYLVLFALNLSVCAGTSS